ncbi:hypothetical protein [Deinococcus sonorensis]|uniref:Uncharacterized protein n=2 Tax=Deinococcus sonorensis TaxID=309891 RepID=A0AAU7UE30_9DEIO
MKKLVLTALTALTLTATASAASVATITNGSDLQSGYDALFTEAGWQAISIPLTDVGGVQPSDLSIAATNLPEGVTLTLTGSEVVGNSLVLYVDTERSDTSTAVNALANVSLMSGGTALTDFQVPVVGVAYNQ